MTERDLKNSDVSKLSSVHIRTIEDIIKRGDCRVSTAIKLAESLKITLDELCRD